MNTIHEPDFSPLVKDSREYKQAVNARSEMLGHLGQRVFRSSQPKSMLRKKERKSYPEYVQKKYNTIIAAHNKMMKQMAGQGNAALLAALSI